MIERTADTIVVHRLVLLVICVFLSACTATPTTRAPSGAGALDELAFTIEYVDRNNKIVPAKFQPQDVVLVFPYIPGDIFGSPDSKPVFIAPVSIEARVAVNLDRLDSVLAPLAATVTDAARASGLALAPADARFARMGTFPHEAETFAPVGGGGFLDPVTRDTMILVYFDRPCTITGDRVAGGDTFSHAIRVPAAGLHWIRVVDEGAGRYTLRNDRAIPEVVFSITLYNLKAL